MDDAEHTRRSGMARSRAAVEAKVREYETLLEERLKVDLQETLDRRDVLYEKISDLCAAPPAARAAAPRAPPLVDPLRPRAQA